jgi:hypothetical protein
VVVASMARVAPMAPVARWGRPVVVVVVVR